MHVVPSVTPKPITDTKSGNEMISFVNIKTILSYLHILYYLHIDIYSLSTVRNQRAVANRRMGKQDYWVTAQLGWRVREEKTLLAPFTNMV